MKEIILVLSLAFLLISTLIYRSDICCMFSASRYYGWPSSFIVVNKTTEYLEEAKKVETESLVYLLKNGWKISFKADIIGQNGLTSMAIVNLMANYFLYLGLAFLIIKGIKYFHIK